MTVTFVRESTIGASIPVAISAQAAITAAVGVSEGQLEGQVEGMARLATGLTSVPVTLAATLAATLDAFAELSATGGTGVGIATSLGVAWSGLLTAQATLKAYNPELYAKIAGCIAAVQALQAQADIDYAAQLSMIASASAEIQGQLTALGVQASFAASLGSLMATAGIRLYRFDGSISVAGAEIQAALNASGTADIPGMAADAHFLFFVPTTSVGWSGIQSVFAT